MPLKDNPTAQEAADYFAETPQHKIRRHKIHIKCLEEVRKQDLQKIAKLEAINTDLLETLEELVAELDNRPLAQGEYGYPDSGGLILARQAIANAKEN